ncbi:MAG TPA: hypothetical protein VFZ09_39660 [Archangium sp.]|uniref:hypothetical protein n=1 Tax=Archangium sp. TaxID=1872627 RepID=UPI002E33014C|nr:hypothetical protein [Archangium sp.]HEX5752390.1 hypothetical protein [Archangium sp.]
MDTPFIVGKGESDMSSLRPACLIISAVIGCVGVGCATTEQVTRSTEGAASEEVTASVTDVPIEGCVRLTFEDGTRESDRAIVTEGFQRVCVALLNPTCPALQTRLSGVNGRTGYDLGWFKPERMSWTEIATRLTRYVAGSPTVRVRVVDGGGTASTRFESTSASALRFDPSYFKSPSVRSDILHTAIHEMLHMLACEPGDPCSGGPRFLDTGAVTWFTPNREFASYQVGNAFEVALADVNCLAQ